MQIWSAAAILEKNKLASDAPFLILLEINHALLPEPVRLVRNNEKTVWNGNTWEAFPFDFDNITEEGATIPSLGLKISNAGGIIQTYIQQYNGFADGTATIMLVHAAHLDDLVPQFELAFTVKETQYSEEWITFTLGPSSESSNRFPISRFIENYCPYKFKSVRCGYAGTADICNNTLDQCRIPKRFGGEPGMSTGS